MYRNDSHYYPLLLSDIPTTSATYLSNPHYLSTNPQAQPLKGSFKCGTNCITCNHITDGRTDYTFSATKETRQILHYIDCNSKTLIYIIHCRRCNKQYIAEKKRRLKDRFNEHRSFFDRPTSASRQAIVSEHFTGNNHTPHDMELIPLELVGTSRDSICKDRKTF